MWLMKGNNDMIKVYVDRIDENNIEAIFTYDDAFENNKYTILKALTGYPCTSDIRIDKLADGIYEPCKKDCGLIEDDVEPGEDDDYSSLGYYFIVVHCGR